jgi:phospholipase/lecithinase/hemolysin
VHNVDAIALHWDDWHPSDDVHALIKRAIDATDSHLDCAIDVTN